MAAVQYSFIFVPDEIGLEVAENFIDFDTLYIQFNDMEVDFQMTKKLGY